jgi:cytidylate kinase
MGPNGLVVAIDGPAGAGKSTVARELARRLGYVYVDTGAMYRVVGLLAREGNVAPEDGGRLGALVDGVSIRFVVGPGGEPAVFANGRDVTVAIREQPVGEWASKVSTRPEVRDRLVAAQRAMGRDGGVVLEGRDIGTVVFPDADVKFYLDATAEERGRRRHRQLQERGEAPSLAAIVAEIQGRDRRDQQREHSPLRCASDASRIDTTTLAPQAVIEELLERCRERLRSRGVGVQKP